MCVCVCVCTCRALEEERVKRLKRRVKVHQFESSILVRAINIYGTKVKNTKGY